MSKGHTSLARPWRPILTWRSVLPAAVLGSVALGLLAAPGPYDPELAMLLRFMAVMKGGMALAAVLLVDWRLRAPVRPVVAGAYLASVAAMAGGAALIWQLAHVGLGAALVHGGLLTALATGWLDRRSVEARWTARRPRASRTGSILPGQQVVQRH